MIPNRNGAHSIKCNVAIACLPAVATITDASVLCYTDSKRNFRNEVQKSPLRRRNSIVDQSATNITVEKTRTYEHI